MVNFWLIQIWVVFTNLEHVVSNEWVSEYATSAILENLCIHSDIDTGASAQEHTCGPHPEGAVFCDGKLCKVFNESTGALRELPETNDYHYGGVMAYVDGVGIVVIGGTSTDAGRIEVFNEDDNEWKQIAQDRFQVHTVKHPMGLWPLNV